MLVDWFTVLAQALNFVILVWLLKRFLYQPILEAIDAREQRIAAELADAGAMKVEAQHERDEFQQKNRAYDQKRTELLNQAKDEASGERERLVDEARRTADTLSNQRRETLKNDARDLNQAIGRRTQQEVFAIARKTLIDLASTSLEDSMVEIFTRRLRGLDEQTKTGLAAAFKAMSQPAWVRSAFELSAEHRGSIQNTLNEVFVADIPVRYETAPDLVSGIELGASGRKVAWSIADYLTTLEKSIGELVNVTGESLQPSAIKPKTMPVQTSP